MKPYCIYCIYLLYLANAPACSDSHPTIWMSPHQTHQTRQYCLNSPAVQFQWTTFCLRLARKWWKSCKKPLYITLAALANGLWTFGSTWAVQLGPFWPNGINYQKSNLLHHEWTPIGCWFRNRISLLYLHLKLTSPFTRGHSYSLSEVYSPALSVTVEADLSINYVHTDAYRWFTLLFWAWRLFLFLTVTKVQSHMWQWLIMNPTLHHWWPHQEKCQAHPAGENNPF